MTCSASYNVINADQLFRQYAPYVAAYMRRLGIPNSSVDDGVQDVFIVAHRLGGYKPGPAACKTWLGAITLRVASNMRRRNRRLGAYEVYDVKMELSAPHGTPETVVLQREELIRLDRILNTLSAGQRDVLVRFRADGESCDQIAQELKIPTGTVYSRLHTARKSFDKLCSYA